MSNKDKKLPERPVLREELDTPLKHDLSHLRDEKCIPVAFQLIKLLAGMEEFPVGSHVKEKDGVVEKNFLPVTREMMKLMIDNDIKVSEAVYIFNITRQAIDVVQGYVDETLAQNMNRVTELVYGLELNDYDQVTIKNLNTVVMNSSKINEVWKPILDEKKTTE
jgi:hypothetical protein